MTEQTPIHTQYREGNQDNPYVYKNENLIIDKNAKAFLTEFPERLYGVEVQSLDGKLFYETQEYSVRENEFNVDYESKTKAITFHQSQIGKQLNFVYKGTGLSYLSPSQIYTELNSEGIMETLDVYIKNMSKLKTQIENLLEKGSVATVAGKSGIVTNGDIHLINTILDGNAGNSATFLPLGVTLYPVKSKNINYPAEKGFVVTYKHSNIQTVQFFYPTEKEVIHFRSWVSNNWTDWKALVTTQQVDDKVANSAIRSSTPPVLVGRAIKDVKGLNLSVDLGGLSGSRRLVKDDYRLEFTASKNSMVESISFPVNGRGKATLVLSEKITPKPKDGKVIAPIITKIESRELYLQPVDVSHLVLFALEKDKTYQLSLEKMDVEVLFETDFDAKNIAENEYIKDSKLTLKDTLIKGYAYFYDMTFSYNYTYQEVYDARTDLTGKVHKSLYDRLLQDFSSVNKLIDELFEIENGFDISKIEPQFWTELGGIRNVVQQYFWINKLNGRVYQTQSDSQAQEGFYINELTPSGHFLGTMHVPRGGHGTSLGVEYVNGQMFMWTNVDKKLVKFTFKVDSELDASTLQDWMPNSVRNVFFAPVSDCAGVKVAFRRSDGIIELRSFSDLNKNIDKVYSKVTIPLEERDNNYRPMQGIAINDDHCYWMSGWGSSDNIGKIFKYDWKGTLLDTVSLNNLTQLTGIGGAEYATDNQMEPEGLFFNEVNGKKTLLVGFSTGGTRKRFHKIFGYFQRGALDRYASISRNGAQNYPLTRGDGKAFSIPNGTTRLADLTKVGHYYVQGSEVEKLIDIPFEFIGTPVWIDNLPAEQHNDIRQVVTRRSTEKIMLKIERVINIGKADQKFSVGAWTVYQAQSTRGEFVYAKDYKNKLSNIKLPMKMYITQEQANLFTDHPISKTSNGWFYENMGYGVTGEFRQTLTINSSVRFETYSRLVYPDRVSKWFVTVGSMIDDDDDSRWQNRNVMFIGDSITVGTAATIRYSDMVAQQLSTHTQSEGVVSSAFSSGTVNQTIPAIVDRLKNINFDDVTHVVFFAGTNDFGRGVELGNINDDNVNTFYGAVQNCINQLKNKKVEISFVTPILRFDGRTNDRGYKLEDFVDALIEVAKLNNLPILNLYNNFGVNEGNKSTYIANDMLHPNNNGQRLLATKIGSFLGYKY